MVSNDGESLSSWAARLSEENRKGGMISVPIDFIFQRISIPCFYNNLWENTLRSRHFTLETDTGPIFIYLRAVYPGVLISPGFHPFLSREQWTLLKAAVRRFRWWKLLRFTSDVGSVSQRANRKVDCQSSKCILRLPSADRVYGLRLREFPVLTLRAILHALQSVRRKQEFRNDASVCREDDIDSSRIFIIRYTYRNSTIIAILYNFLNSREFEFSCVICYVFSASSTWYWNNINVISDWKSIDNLQCAIL